MKQKQETKKRRRYITDEERQFLAQAERMYIREKKSIKEVSSITGIHVRKLYRWRKEYNWNDRLFDWETSAAGIAEKTMKMLHEYIDSVDKLDGKVTDRLIKTASALRKLDQDFDVLGTTLMIVEELIFWLRVHHADAFKKLQEVIPDFLMYMRDKFKK